MKKVYELSWDGDGYGRGLMIVAADSPEEALKLAHTNSTSWREPEIINRLSYEGESRVIRSEYYQE